MAGPRSMTRRAIRVSLGVSVLLAGLGRRCRCQGIILTGGITDPGNVLGACREQVLDADKALFDATGTNVFTVLVPGDGSDSMRLRFHVGRQRVTHGEGRPVRRPTGEPHARLLQGAT